MRTIVEAEIMSEGNIKLRILLETGETIEGYSLGIMPLTDIDGEELEEDALYFEAVVPGAYYRLTDKDIKKVEKAT